MPPDGAGSQRISVIGAATRPPPGAPPPDPARMARRPRAAPTRTRTMQQSGWTTRRLSVAAVLGAAAVIAGGLVFVAKFGGDRAPGDNPFMAFAFGLFVIGMVVFCAAVIALIGTAISVLADTRGWAPAAAVAFAPLAVVWMLYLAGVVGYAIPAVLSLVLIGGFVVALPRRSGSA
jgi:hypothetical protein